MQQAPAILRDDVKRELAGERVLWAGVPTRWGYVARSWKTALFGIPFTAFSVFYTFEAGGVSGKGEHAFMLFFPLWGMIFVAIGLTMLLSPLFEALAAGRTYYVVTERRSVIFERRLRLKIHSFHATGFGGFERVSRGGNGGDIVFQRNVERGSKGGARTTEVGFFGLADVFRAEKALEEMLARAKSG